MLHGENAKMIILLNSIATYSKQSEATIDLEPKCIKPIQHKKHKCVMDGRPIFNQLMKENHTKTRKTALPLFASTSQITFSMPVM